MDELKLIFASNLIRLRTAAGMTQAELGEQLNYSDKSISKCCLLYTSPSPRDMRRSRMPSSA